MSALGALPPSFVLYKATISNGNPRLLEHNTITSNALIACVRKRSTSSSSFMIIDLDEDIRNHPFLFLQTKRGRNSPSPVRCTHKNANHALHITAATQCPLSPQPSPTSPCNHHTATLHCRPQFSFLITLRCFSVGELGTASYCASCCLFLDTYTKSARRYSW